MHSALFSCQPPRRPPDICLPPVRLRAHGPHGSGRKSVEDFIRRVYAARYGADVRSFAPVLVSLADGERTVAAAGYRPAALGPLYLERYLSAPVETLLPAGAGMRPGRNGIVEVAHLAADRFGEGLHLIRLLGECLAEQRFEWVVSTVTQELRKLFTRLKVVPHPLAVAEPSVLGEDAARWGSYYEHRPVVLAGRLAPAVDLISGRLAPKRLS